MLIGEQVEFLYRGKDGQVTERRGEVVPNNEKTVSTVTHFTIRTPDGKIKSFDKSRCRFSAFPYVL
jgi:hypothetical protein